jgi:hypothetical protein
VTVVVDLPAVRPARLASALVADDLAARVRGLRDLLRGATVEPVPGGVRLDLRLDVRGLAALADLVRAEAAALPFFTFRLLADPPRCRLEVTGEGQAGALARALFGELGA